MKKETMKEIGNPVKHIDTVFEKWKKSQQKQTKKLTNTKQQQIEIITFNSKDNRYSVET